MKKIPLILLLLVSFIASASAQSNYSDQRLRADMNPETMQARSQFRSFINRTFRHNQQRYKLNQIKFSFNDRMIAQFGRGAASAFKELPKDLNLVMKFIRTAQISKRALLKDLSTNYRTLRKYSDHELLRAIEILATTKALHLDYWGYLNGYKAPTMNLKNQRLIYYAKWFEAESFYKATHEKQLRSNIMRGIIADMNHTPWYKNLFN